ncbi:lysoplasmalogenase family protein [Sphingomonas sp.]
MSDSGKGLWLWWTAIAAGAGFIVAGWSGVSGLWMLPWKGLCVALLALWAWRRTLGIDGAMLAAALACGAIGDVLIDAIGLVEGASAFAIGHVVAIFLYQRHRRASLSRSQAMLGYLVAPVTVAIAWTLTRDLAVCVYAALLGSMAGMAWTSRFPRYWTGLGAMLFVASDLAIFARIGIPRAEWTGWLVLPLYFAGQAMIARGGVRYLSSNDRRPAR